MSNVIDEVKFQIHRKEKFYFILKVIAALFGYFLIVYGFAFFYDAANPMTLRIVLTYIGLFVFLFYLQMGLLIGYLRGNAVKVSDKQFPEINAIVQRQSKQLRLKRPPTVFLLQQGGLLNAFATRFTGINYVVIYSDVLEEAFDNNIDTVEFIIGHELGHVKRNHILKRLLTLPSVIIPFLDLAYSRACEYTCDDIGFALNKRGASMGLILLASGKRLWRRVNYAAFVEQEKTENGFWMWLAEKFSTHPRTSRRASRFAAPKTTEVNAPRNVETPVEEKSEPSDHSRFMPGS